MKQKTKYLIAFLFIGILFFIPNFASAATIEATETTTTSTGKTVSWSYELDSSNNIVNLKCTNISSVSGALEIPETIDGYTVVTIGNTANGYSDGAFQDCSGLTGITIPNTVTTIGYKAFYNCTGLKTLTIPDSVTSLGEYAFYGCTGITQITFSNNLSSIGSYAFQNCTGLKSITLPSSLTTIGSRAFSKCTGLSEIVIPDSVTTVGDYAFYGCTGLKSVTLSNSMTKIGKSTFYNCSGITSIIIPESVTTIEGDLYDGAFEDCTNLEKILIPDSVATIGDYAFYGCNKLTIYGNDDQASKTYAEENSINFKYISQWDESDIGDDITPPYVENIQVPLESVAEYYDSNSTTYIVPSGKVLIINVNFNETILATKVPSLTIKFGSGSNIVLTEGTVSGKTVAYTYTIASGDVGTMATVSLVGGNITDEAGNEATLSCPSLKVTLSNHYIYANGTAVDVEDGNNNSSSNSSSNSSNNNSSNTNNSNSSNNSNSNNSDNTTATGTIPQTGVGAGIIVALIALIGVSVFARVKYNKYKNI